MPECPQGTCDNIEKLLSKTNESRMCIKGKVGWKQAGITLLALLSIFTTVVLVGMAAEKKQNEKIAEIPVIQKDIEHIKINMRKMDSKLDVIQTQVQKGISKDDLNRLIKVIRDGT